MTRSKLSATTIIPPPIAAVAAAVAPLLPSLCRRRCLLFAAAAAFSMQPLLQPLCCRRCLLIAAASLAIFAVALLLPSSPPLTLNGRRGASAVFYLPPPLPSRRHRLPCRIRLGAAAAAPPLPPPLLTSQPPPTA